PDPLSVEEGLVVEEGFERIERTYHVKLKVGVMWKVAYDARDLQVDEVVQPQALSYRILRAEIFCCGGFRQDDTVRSGKGVVGGAADKPKVVNLKQVLFGEDEVVFIILYV